MKNGGNVQIYTYNGSNAQNFVIKSWKAPGNYKAIQAGNYRLYPAAASGLSIDVQVHQIVTAVMYRFIRQMVRVHKNGKLFLTGNGII